MTGLVVPLFATVDHVTGQVTIDGKPFPYAIALEGPDVETTEGGVVILRLPILVAETVTVRSATSRRVYDRVLGAIGETLTHADENLRAFKDAIAADLLRQVREAVR